MDALYERGFLAGIEAAKDAVQHVIDTSGYGYVAWRDVLAAIDATAARQRRRSDGN